MESRGSFNSHKGMSLVSILIALGHRTMVLHSQMTFQIYCYLVLKSMWKVHGRYRNGSQWNAPCFNPQEQCALNTKACGVRRMDKTIMPNLYIDYKKCGNGKFKKLIYQKPKLSKYLRESRIIKLISQLKLANFGPFNF